MRACRIGGDKWWKILKMTNEGPTDTQVFAKGKIQSNQRVDISLFWWLEEGPDMFWRPVGQPWQIVCNHQNLMARALYDNVPECAEELAFRKGDILTVIEQNTEGLEGWWLCSLHGRQGIAPGNRLKLLIGPAVESPPNQDMSSAIPVSHAFHQQQVYQVPSSQPSYRDPAYQVPPVHLNQGVYQVPTGHGLPGQDVYQVPPSTHRSLWGMDSSSVSNKVVTPTRIGQGYVYETPPRYQTDTYDVPPARPQGVYDIPPASAKGPVYASSPGELTAQGVYDIPPSKGICAISPSIRRDSTATMETAYDFPLSMKQRPEGVYDVPPPSTKATAVEMSVKCNGDVEATSDLFSRKHGLYDIPLSHQNQLLGHQTSPLKDLYDVPRGVQFPGQQGGTGDSLSPERGDGVYDVPPTVTQDAKGMQDVTDGMNRLSFSSTGSTRSNMSTSSTTSKESSASASPFQDKGLGLDPDTAIERLYWLQQMVETSVSRLNSFVNSEWRSYMYMEKHINEIHSTVDKVEQSLLEFLQFAKGATVNASCLSELSLHNKMRRELHRLEDSYQILSQTSHDLNGCSWSLNALATNKPHNKCDNLERFVMVARTVSDDTKQLTTTVSINAELLFKRLTSSPQLKHVSENIMSTADYLYHSSQMAVLQGEKAQEHCSAYPPALNQEQHAECNSSSGSEKSWMDDYDYVHLQGKEEFERQQKELLEKENIIKQSKMQLEQHQLSQFQQLEQEITTPVENDITKWQPPQSIPVVTSTLASQDRQLLFFYSSQCETHFISLLNAIDAFFSCISTAQPPRIFVAHSKFVILSAHKLVFIGDTLSRQVVTQDIRNRVMNSSNQLCKLLKVIVTATKMAALHYPSTRTLQEMVDRVTELSNHAQLFKLSLAQMASL